MDIQLLRPHTHNGRDYAAGDTLMMDDSLAAWLIRKKIAKKAMDAPVKPEHDREFSKSKGGKKQWAQNLTQSEGASCYFSQTAT